VVSLEDLGPEAGQLMAVVDLNDMELLKDAAVKSHLVVFEAGEDFAAEVDAHDIVELGLCLQIALISLEVVLDFVHITSALEKSVHRFLASLDTLDR